MEIKDAMTSTGISLDSYEDNYSNTVRVDFEALECIMAHVTELEQREKQLVARLDTLVGARFREGRDKVRENKYFYYIPEKQETEDDAREFESVFDEEDTLFIVMDACEEEWIENDGWKWMRDGASELVLLRADMTEICRYNAIFEIKPALRCTEIKRDL